MKKVLFSFLLLMIFVNVNAIDNNFSLIINGNDTITDDYTLDLAIDSAYDICGFVMDISYDSNKLEIISYEGKNGFTVTYGDNRLVLDSDNCKKSGNVLSMSFKAKESFTNSETVQISFSDIEGGDGDNLYHAGNVSKTITKEKEIPNTGVYLSLTTILALIFASIIIVKKTGKEKRFV